MYQLVIAIHVLLGLGIIGLVMMQQGKGADAGASFGSGSAGSVFGAQGAASFLSRTTAILATLFFITSLSLAVINGHKGGAVDIMSTPAVTDAPPTVQVPVAPVADSAPSVDTQAATPIDEPVKPPSMSQTAAPELKPEASTEAAKPEAPVVVPVVPAPVKVDNIEKIEVPKAEPIKPVEESKKVEEPKAEAVKAPAVEHDKKSGHNKAAKHHAKADKHKKHD